MKIEKLTDNKIRIILDIAKLVKISQKMVSVMNLFCFSCRNLLLLLSNPLLNIEKPQEHYKDYHGYNCL